MTASAPKPVTEIERLRLEWPDWGFLRLGQRWIAVQGATAMVEASSAQALRAMLPPPQTCAATAPRPSPSTTAPPDDVSQVPPLPDGVLVRWQWG